MHLGIALQRHSEPIAAEAASLRSIELTGGGVPFVAMHSKHALGLVFDERGDPSGADLLAEVQGYFRHVGDLGCLNGVNRALADIARRQGDDESRADAAS